MTAYYLQGGESTLEEMCLAFPVFYPRLEDGSTLISCVSLPDVDPSSPTNSFTDFVTYLSRLKFGVEIAKNYKVILIPFQCES